MKDLLFEVIGEQCRVQKRTRSRTKRVIWNSTKGGEGAEDEV